jgi:hypothetical protein
MIHSAFITWPVWTWGSRTRSTRTLVPAGMSTAARSIAARAARIGRPLLGMRCMIGCRPTLRAAPTAWLVRLGLRSQAGWSDTGSGVTTAAGREDATLSSLMATPLFLLC